MQDPKTWKMLSKHLAGDESVGEKETFLKWLDQSENNKELFHRSKAVWDGAKTADESLKEKRSATFWGRFTKQKIKDFVIKQAIGHLIGFIIGMWITASFSHYVLERRTLKNLFGLAGRKKIAVNEVPEWLQTGMAILVGFIALELINYFFQTEKHIIIWEYIKRSFIRIKKE